MLLVIVGAFMMFFLGFLLGYAQAPLRKFLFGYFIIAVILGYTPLIFPLNCDGWEFLLVPFVPGWIGMAIGGSFIENTTHTIIAGICCILLVEVQGIFTCYHIGRWLGNKSGNIHRF